MISLYKVVAYDVAKRYRKGTVWYAICIIKECLEDIPVTFCIRCGEDTHGFKLFYNVG